MKLKGEPLVLEAYGRRIYTHFCAVCGKVNMDEDDAMSKVQCGGCGNDTLRLIRDHKMEGMMIENAQTGWGNMQ